MSLDATPGGTNSNSFADVAYADNYHASRLHNQEWVDASTPTKEATLIWASRTLNEYDWSGTIDVLSTQSLRFPRENLYDQDDRLLSPLVNPRFIRDATSELALWYIREEQVNSGPAEERIKIGPIDLGFYESTIAESSLPDYVSKLINFFLSNPIGAMKVTRT